MLHCLMLWQGKGRCHSILYLQSKFAKCQMFDTDILVMQLLCSLVLIYILLQCLWRRIGFFQGSIVKQPCKIPRYAITEDLTGTFYQLH